MDLIKLGRPVSHPIRASEPDIESKSYKAYKIAYDPLMSGASVHRPCPTQLKPPRTFDQTAGTSFDNSVDCFHITEIPNQHPSLASSILKWTPQCHLLGVLCPWSSTSFLDRNPALSRILIGVDALSPSRLLGEGEIERYVGAAPVIRS